MTPAAIIALVGPWHVETFGDLTFEAQIAKLRQEIDELAAAPADKRAEEAADVAIVLAGLCYRESMKPAKVQPVYDRIDMMPYDVDLLARSWPGLRRMEGAAAMLFGRLHKFVGRVNGGHLLHHVKKKMIINRTRTWARQADGTFQHVRGEG